MPWNRVIRLPVFVFAFLFGTTTLAETMTPRPMVVVDGNKIAQDEAPPHGKIGMSTVHRLSDHAPARTMEFRKRILHKDAAIGLHVINHDEVYYVLDGQGMVTSDDETRVLTSGMAVYLYSGANVGIKQMGESPLALIISYPLKEPTK